MKRTAAAFLLIALGLLGAAAGTATTAHAATTHTAAVAGVPNTWYHAQAGSVLFTWTESPGHPEPADDAWWVDAVHAAAVKRGRDETPADDDAT